MSNFYQRQYDARSGSHRLVFLYLLAVLSIGLVLHAAIAFGLTFDEAATSDFATVFLDPSIAFVTLGLTFLVIGGTSLFKVAQLRQGGPAVAKLMGGIEVSPNTHAPAEKRLLNVVEEMALASGVKMPRVYVMRDEGSLNAFAAGYSPDAAAVAVTSGLLTTLNREELQAVIGHEFSHILNGDMRLNIRLIGILHGILALSLLGHLLFRIAAMSNRRSSRNSKNNPAALFFMLGLLLWILGSLGVFFGRLIQAAISRKREHLADASAIQFTRNPQSMANALVLVATGPRKLENHNAGEIAHMLFASAFSTHPPILDRIRACDPSFDGDLTKARERLLRNRL
jgi:Zn-dependent protease with chaperone function